MKTIFKVLIAEEEKEFVSSDANIFEEHGFIHEFCEMNGRKVLEEIGLFEPDIVLMDTFLSGIDGIGVIKKAKTLYQDKAPLFVLISHFTSPIIEREAIEAGAACYIIKPFAAEDILDRAADLIRFIR